MSSFLVLVHPVHVEAVTGIVGRAELLCAFFLLLGVRVWMRCLLDGSSLLGTLIVYLVCTGLFVLGVLSKETCFVLPILLWVFQWLWGARSFRSWILPWHRTDRNQLLFSLVYWSAVCGIYLLFRKWMVVHDTIPVNRQVSLIPNLPTREMQSLIRCLLMSS